MFKIIERFDGNSEAERYLLQNTDNDNFRKKMTRRYFERGEYVKVLELCLEGEEHDKKYAGLVHDYRKIRYSVYEALNDIDSQKELAELFVNKGEFSYYAKLKALFTSGEWREKLPALLGSVHKQNYGTYLKIIVCEKLTAPLLAHCERNKRDISEYASLLVPEYSQKVEKIFSEYIFESAKRSCSRGDYKAVCSIIKAYKSYYPGGASEIIAALTANHKRQPAFLDELGKVKV